MSKPLRRVDCPSHGEQEATFVCRHVAQTARDGIPRGFWPGDDPDTPRPSAWCSACEQHLQKTGGEWTEENEDIADITLLCGACYDRAKAINEDADGRNN